MPNNLMNDILVIIISKNNIKKIIRYSNNKSF